MANFPCDILIDCDCTQTPFRNLSSEAPDLPSFRSIGYGRIIPPLGEESPRIDCAALCESFVSQELADFCALVQAYDCLTQDWNQDGGTNNPTAAVPPPVNTFGRVPFFRAVNGPQTGTVNCPDGLPFEFSVPAGLFFGGSRFSQASAQADADAKAVSYAQQQALFHQVCLSALAPSCVNAAMNQEISASGATVSEDRNVWEVTGVLPPGLSIPELIFTTALAGPVIHLQGTPTVPGTYPFTVTVTTPDGDSMSKNYNFVVKGITNADSLAVPSVGQPYSQDLLVVGFANAIFSIEGGALPDGLTLDPGGIITGTPTTQGTFDFTVGITDAGTGVTCLQDLELEVESDVGCSDVPVQTFTTPVFYTNLAAVPNDALLMACDGFTPTFDLYDVADGLMTFLTTQTSSRTFGRMAWSPLADEWVYVGVDGGTDSWFESYNKTSLAMTGSALALAGIAPPFIPWALNVSAATGMAYASVNNSGDIIVSYNTVTRLAGPNITLPVPSNLGSIGINDAANRVYFAGGHNNTIGTGPAQLIVRNATTLAAVAAHNLPNPFGHGYVQGCVYNPDTGMVYVAGNDEDADGGDVIWVVNPVTGAVITTIRLLTNIWDLNHLIQPNATTLVYVPARHQIYVFASEHKTFPNANGGIQVICCDTNSKIAFLNLNPDPAFGSDIGNVDVQNVINTVPPDTLTVFVTEENNGTVREFTFP